jgi:hypothetical protein
VFGVLLDNGTVPGEVTIDDDDRSMIPGVVELAVGGEGSWISIETLIRER